jgi:hypothetical protein
MTQAAEHTAASDRRASVEATSRVVRRWLSHSERDRRRRTFGIAAMHDGGPYVRARCADRHRFFERQPEKSARPEVSRRDGHSMGMGLAGAGARLLALGACLCLGACGEPGSLARGAGGVTGPTPLVEAALPANQGAAATRPSRGRLNQAATPPRVQHVVTVVLENTDYEQAIAQPFLAQLARNGGLLTNYSAVAHPSQPNYFALTAGSTFGASNDRVTLNARHIGNLIEAKGGSWKAYAEQYRGQCDTGTQSGNYVRRHEPFISFQDVQGNPARCQRIVNAAQFQSDVAQGTLPNYALYVPDLKNDGHDTGVGRADRWLASTFGPLLQDPRFRRNTLLVVTFDEGQRGNHVYTVVSGDAVAPGSTSSAAYDHFSLLRTTEQVLGVGNLGQADATAPVITGIWQ